MFINHLHATGRELPPFGPYLCEYLTASNGVFVRAKRPGLEVLLPVCLGFNGGIRGLFPLTPYVHLEAGPIPASLIRAAVSRMAASAPDELLVWVGLNGAYHLTIPEQTATENHCKPVNPLDLRGQNALLDFHSHGFAPPFFSTIDNKDESRGFRLYAVAGNFPNPTLLVRVGIYGHFWQFPPDWVMELPPEIAPEWAGEAPCLDRSR
jgi:PRTRC genetic system protein A